MEELIVFPGLFFELSDLAPDLSPALGFTLVEVFESFCDLIRSNFFLSEGLRLNNFDFFFGCC